MLKNVVRMVGPAARQFHTTTTAARERDGGLPECSNWIKRNEKVHPPEKPVTPYVVHYRPQIKYSRKKMLPLTWLVRGLSVDEARAQLEFDKRYGAQVMKEVIEEAMEIAVKEHHIEYRSNLWISDMMVNKGVIHKGLRQHARGKVGEIRYAYCHLFLRLEEGEPPKHYYAPPLTPEEKLKFYIKELDERYVMFSH